MITIASRVRTVPLASAALLLLAGAAHAVDIGGSKPSDASDQLADDRAYENGVIQLDDLRLGYGFLPPKTSITILPKGGGFTVINYDKTTNWDKTGRTGLT